MSWWVTLEKDDGFVVPVESHQEGGTYALEGTNEARLNITYNYGDLFRKVWPEPPEHGSILIQMLDGRTAENTIPLLEESVQQLGTTPDPNYWKPTPGNAGRALAILLTWARQHPKAVWRVS